MRRVIFRADGGGTTGYGHFIRSLALAGYLRNDFECFFSTYNSINCIPTDYQLKEIECVCTHLPIEGDSIEEANENFLGKLKADDIIVLDNYYYTTKYQERIKDLGCKLVCIDDMHDRHMVCDLLITPSPLKREDFSLEPYTRFIGGIEWAFLRPPFLNQSFGRRKPSRISSVVLAIGGADPLNLTDKMVEIVNRVLPEVEINIIAGDTVIISDKSKQRSNVYTRLTASEIVQLFDRADLGVFPTSTICIEAFSRQLPVAGGYYVENQELFYNYATLNKLIYPLGCMCDDASEIAERLKNAIEQPIQTPTHIDFASKKQQIIDLFKEL